MNKQYNTAITYGTFDLFHIGHLNLLKQMKNLASRVIIGVCSDEFCLNKTVKKCTTYSTEERVAIISSIKYVDYVIIENSPEQKLADIIKYNVDLFVIGDDWQGKFDHFKSHCDVLYLNRTKNISTSKIKELIKNA